MISHRMRENRRVRALKLPKNIERLYKEGKCRECAVVVTRMDFAKILGKFTKVKIQYESSTPKTKKNDEVTSPNSNARLKSNENGMVLLRRSAYNQHPVKEILGPTKKAKANQNSSSQPASNVLKENNRLKKTLVKDKNSNLNISSCNVSKKTTNAKLKQYGIIFSNPISTKKNDLKSNTSLGDLLPLVNKSILPTDEWLIDYLPHNEEPMDDKVYDRIAAELEDLMYNEKLPDKCDDKPNRAESKVDEFPSIMDILNDTSENSKPSDQSASVEFKTTLESSDVESMLLGKTASPGKAIEPTAMEVDSSAMSNLIEDVAQLNAINPTVNAPIDKVDQPIVDVMENPHSPSILDEALQQGIEEHLPCDPSSKSEITLTENNTHLQANNIVPKSTDSTLTSNNSSKLKKSSESKPVIPSSVTHLIFKKNSNGKCSKAVTCPKNLVYSIEIDGKPVEFLGAPKVLSSLEDLQVLLQIVNETELKNLYVYHEAHKLHY